eukprot:CAMPEP_0183431012 /NCGR_PEP_ID=MMETSP0370-20130417/54535_1 /TAXON_ID=268820 /ORGANISM="Peridinium aciculiferum, Strain PAER-2" /LENGTH=36 /DNA_ID= /DNA_START= /DNA_END= /DNA_ORIENTATION=
MELPPRTGGWFFTGRAVEAPGGIIQSQADQAHKVPS